MLKRVLKKGVKKPLKRNNRQFATLQKNTKKYDKCKNNMGFPSDSLRVGLVIFAHCW